MKFTEEALESAIIELLQWQWYPYHHGSTIHKEISDVLLRDDLQSYLLSQYADEDITLNEVHAIIRKLELYPSSSLYDSNRQIMKLISDWFIFKREDRTKKDLYIELIDFQNKKNNIKFVNQLEIQGYEKRIPDWVLYINGLPLVVFEFKSSIKENATIRNAYTQLTTRYRRDIPELFKYNAFCVISDGVNNKMWWLFAPYDFFYAWRKTDIDSKPADGIDSLFTMINGLFDKDRLLEVIKDFVYFPDQSRDELKIVCRYPQFYAAKRLFENIKINLKPNGSGKGGTYFGATGSGKSYTMLYLTRLLMKSKELSNPTIVLITDRIDLDDQLAGQFGNAKEFIGDDTVVSVTSRDDLKELLQWRNSGWVFLTTIHKFTENTDLLTDRNNVICISDEAHRSQINLDKKTKIHKEKWVIQSYWFAKYLHDSLPNATYVGFTGTPIDATLNVFGPVIDMYTMKESVEDNITVRIVYEWRAAKVFLEERKLKEIEEYYKKCEDEWANEYQIEESKRASTKMDVILGDKDVIRILAKDFVDHYEARVSEWASVLWKVMFVAPSRPIAYQIYQEIIALRPQWAEIKKCDDWVELSEKDKKDIKPMEKVKLIMTRWKDDPKELWDMIWPKEHKKEFDRQFKNKKSNFKIAIVVDMWLTGFDVPFLDTIYIYKPLQQHSLIQTISRVNRVYEWKESWLVVDYIGIKSNMNLALKKYSNIDDEDFEDIEKAVVVVKDQLDLLNKLFIKFDSKKYFSWKPLEKLDCLNKAVEFVQITESVEKRFASLVKKLRSAYNLSCSSEEITHQERDQIHFYFAIKSILHKLTRWDAPDTSQMNEKVRELIQEAIISDWVEEIFKLWDNEQNQNIDIFSDEYLEKIDKIKLPNTKIKLLQQLLNKAINEYKKTNKIKWIDFSKKLKKLVDAYNERKEDLAFASEVLDDVAEQFTNLYHELKKDINSFIDLWINFEEKAFYDILKDIAKKHGFDYPEDKLIELSKAVKIIVDDKTKYTDWAQKADIKAELKVDLILTLAEHGYPPVTKDEVFKEIFEQAENFKKYVIEE